MKTTRAIAIAVIASSFGLILAEQPAQAKSLREAEIPAEFPPASYQGKQYVDSRGCVYIRAGIDGLVNWVPRVTRSREVLCGYQPTFAKTDEAPVAAPKPADVPVITPEPEVKQAEAPKPEATPAAAPKPAAKPAPARVVAQAPKPKPAAAAKPRRVVQPAPKPAPAPATVAIKQAPAAGVSPTPDARQITTCEGVTGISRYYAGVSRDGLPVRCGPQAEPFVTVVRREPVTVMRDGKKVVVQQRVAARTPKTIAVNPAVPPAPGTGGTRVVPLHVWKQQQDNRVDAPVPEGYRRAWTDDRLNEKRAHQTLDGIYASGLAWTNTVPRKLYVRETGLVVTQNYPGLIYPYHSYAEMQAAGYSIPDTGVLKEDRRLFATKSAPKPAAQPVRKSAKPKTLVSTKRKPPAVEPQKTAKAAAKGRYIQVGAFSQPANAEKTAARLRAMGLRARLATLTRGGKSYRIVLTGPHAPSEVSAALGKARKAGFRDAFVR